MFDTLLIANRGEIALRILRTAHAMGLRVVAVYSEADADAPHVRAADAAVCIGPANAADSYLNTDRILQAAQQTGAGAIHPGYGFLSENAGFAAAVRAAGLVFVGPSAHAITVMGDKARAKQAMLAAGVPCVPGYDGDNQDPARLCAEAEAIGFPIMVKAAAGGGGKGMRLVATAADLAAALDRARAEAEAAFGDGRLILERALIEPRHVEVQVMGDAHGTLLHLGERDCSVQRRHQKVIEEAPCPAVDPALRAALGQAAVAAARAVDYSGAGTVEFLLDAEGGFHFLEMNTRLQVEHPVTELVTGLDLVALQLRVAMGHPLGLRQEDIALTGHAIEVRLYAEDPVAGFLPAAGPVLGWHPGRGLRCDDGIVSGGQVSPHYDPMLAKLVAHGPDRATARARLIRGLQDTALFGTVCNRDFLLDALAQSEFAEGAATTGFVARHYGDRFTPPPLAAQTLAAATLVLHRLAMAQARENAPHVVAELLGWASALQPASTYDIELEHTRLQARLDPRDGGWRLSLHGPELESRHEARILDWTDGLARVEIDGQRIALRFLQQGRDLHLATPGRSLILRDMTGQDDHAANTSDGTLRAPMHGRLVALGVAAGDRVTRGQGLAVLEAMKMQHEIRADQDGTVAEIAAAPGDQVAAGAALLRIQPDP